MPVYEDSLCCKEVDIKEFKTKIKNENLIIKECNGCGKEGIIKPFKLVRNTLENFDRDKYINDFIKSAYAEENGLYIVCIQHDNKKGCYCFAYERVLPDPPAPRPHHFTRTELYNLFGIGEEPDYQPVM